MRINVMKDDLRIWAGDVPERTPFLKNVLLNESELAEFSEDMESARAWRRFARDIDWHILELAEGVPVRRDMPDGTIVRLEIAGGDES